MDEPNGVPRDERIDIGPEGERLLATGRVFLQSIIDGAPAAIYVKNQAGRYRLVNEALLRLLGMPAERVLGRTDADLFAPDVAAALRANDLAVWSDGVRRIFDERVQVGNTVHYFHAEKFLLPSPMGERQALCGILVDMTEMLQTRAELEDRARMLRQSSEALEHRTRELLQTQARLEIAIAAAGMGVWDWSLTTDRATWSPELFAMLGLDDTGAGESRGQALLSVVHPDDRQMLDDALARAISSRGSFDCEFRIVHAGGAVRWLLSRGRVLRDAQGQPERMVGVNLDITERKEAERALQQMDTRRNEFLAMLAHELRNPLAPITNAVRLLEKAGPRPAGQQTVVQILRRQTAHLARLVDDLLEVSRVTQGRIELKRENILAASAILSAVEAVRPLIREQQQQLDVDVPADIELVADAARLTQVVANLLNNAAKYTPRGGHIRVAARDVDDTWVEIEVSDDGTGIDPDVLPRVFDLFAQGVLTLDRARGGLGIGLSLVKRLVELHGGSVAAFSQGPGCGSTFVVRLLRADRRLSVRSAAAPDEPATPAPRTILVADDNADAARSLGMLLEADEHRVLLAHDGVRALELARAERPAVALLDLGMPGMDGYAVARALRAEPAADRPLLIAVTGYGQAADRERSREAGFDAHLLKPVEIADIYRIMTDATPHATPPE